MILTNCPHSGLLLFLLLAGVLVAIADCIEDWEVGVDVENARPGRMNSAKPAKPQKVRLSFDDDERNAVEPDEETGPDSVSGDAYRRPMKKPARKTYARTTPAYENEEVEESRPYRKATTPRYSKPIKPNTYQEEEHEEPAYKPKRKKQVYRQPDPEDEEEYQPEKPAKAYPKANSYGTSDPEPKNTRSKKPAAAPYKNAPDSGSYSHKHPSLIVEVVAYDPKRRSYK